MQQKEKNKMNTPIADFVRGYEKQNITRLHMPGHKGRAFVGCEGYDITEVAGADSLYEADGIIAESEANATKLFGTGGQVLSDTLIPHVQLSICVPPCMWRRA